MDVHSAASFRCNVRYICRLTVELLSTLYSPNFIKNNALVIIVLNPLLKLGKRPIAS